MNRNEIISSLKNNPSPAVLIVGAGINGVGTFRDLALNGVDVLLIDRGDFCFGASAASSHMAHGGIRYLENGEFRLVREAVGERNRMIQNAPHLVRPLPTTVPMFKIFSGLLNAPLKFLNWLDRPSERGAVVIKAGLMLYDAFTGKTRTVPRHQFRNRRDSLARWPSLNPAIRYTATYFDGAILSPERYTAELVLDAEADGGRALNYVSLAGFEGDSAILRDELTGSTFDVKPSLIVNAAGPWIDAANGTLGLRTRYIGGTKGSHLVLDHPELRAAIGEDEFFFENQDGRIVLIFPFFDKVLIGTSDIPIEDPDSARCTDQEVEYFLEMVARVFPSIKVTREHIVFEFSGVRPLAYSKAKTTGQITRDHQIHEDRFGNIPVYSLVGGKWTSYRAFSEQVADKVLDFLGIKRNKDTRQLPIGGGRAYPRNTDERQRLLQGWQAWTNLPVNRLEELFDRYGTLAEKAALNISKGQDQPLETVAGYSRREIGYLARREKIVHLDDLLLRRSRLAMLGHVTRPALDELAQILAETLEWDVDRKKSEVSRTIEILADKHGIDLGQGSNVS
ncbi:MAG: glycerol-3-phosphate dehydrogenase/oxidase [Chloroflexota bacterium]